MYQSRSAACYLGICVFLLGVPSGAPAGVSQDASLPAPTLRVSTHLVLLDVVVTDKTGKPMTGLSSDDFTVKESGKPQKISFFTAPTQTVAPLAPALPPGVYSNAPAYRTAGGPPTVIVLDAANTQYRDQAFARLQMLKFVSNQYKPGQRIAIFTLTNKLSLVQDFTDNPEVLRAALEKMRGTETELSKASAPALETPQTAAPRWPSICEPSSSVRIFGVTPIPGCGTAIRERSAHRSDSGGDAQPQSCSGRPSGSKEHNLAHRRISLQLDSRTR